MAKCARAGSTAKGLTAWLIFYSTWQPYSVHFTPRQATTTTTTTTTGDDVCPKLVCDGVELPAARLRHLFETASALRRRLVYAQARKHGVDRLAWPGLLTSSLPSSMDEQRLASEVATAAAPSYHEVGCVHVCFMQRSSRYKTETHGGSGNASCGIRGSQMPIAGQRAEAIRGLFWRVILHKLCVIKINLCIIKNHCKQFGQLKLLTPNVRF